MQTANAVPPAPKPLDRTVWIAIAGLGVTQIIGWGSTYYLLTILGRPIAESIGVSPAFTASGLSLLLMLGAVMGPFAGRFMDRNGARPAMATGSLIAALGLAVLSQVEAATGFIVAWLVIGSSSALILYPAAFTALTQAAPHNARRAITMLTLPGGLASTVFWPLTSHLSTVMDWRSICLVYAGLNVLVCLPIHMLALPGFSSTGAGAAQTEAQGPQGLPEAARPRAFWLFALVLAFNALLVTGTLNQFIALLTDLGQQHSHAVLCGMLFGISQLSARVVDMLANHRTDALTTGVAVATGFVLSLLGLLVAGTSPVAAVLFAVLMGASNGVLTIIRGTLVLQLFGLRGFGERLGTITVAQGLAGASGPIVLSSILATVGARATLLFCMMTALMALVAMLALFRHVTRASAARAQP